MMLQSKGKMYLAADRGCTETDWFRSHGTFAFGAYQPVDKSPFGPLYVLNSDTLAGGKSFSLRVEELSEVLVLPVVGAIDYSDTTGNTNSLEAGQIQRFVTPAGTTVSFTNPYADDPVHFVQVWMKKPEGKAGHVAKVVRFGIEEKKNQLIDLFATTTGDSRIFIGKFGGREEWVHRLGQQGNTLFFYVLEGAFEVANRLLETGDGLALWEVAEVEMEALSNDAILLVIEMASAAPSSVAAMG